MTELSALNVRITGDAGDLKAAVSQATTELNKVGAAAGRVSSATVPMVGSLGRVAQAMSGARGQIQNVSWQLQDVAVQMQMGTNAGVIFAQQGSQIASAFGPVGAVIGAVLAVTPLLAVAFMNTGDNAASMADNIKELAEATDAFRVSADALRFGVDEEEVALVREVNRLMEDLTRLNEQWQNTQSLGARQRIAEEANAIKSTLAPLQAQLKAYRDAREEAKRLKEEADRVAEAAKAAAVATGGIGAAAAGAIGAVRSLGAAMWDVANAAMARVKAENALEAMKMEFSPGGQALSKYGGRGVTSNRPVMIGNTGQELGVGDGVGGGVGSGVGGGGGGGSNPIIGELEALQQSLMTQEEVQLESYMRQQETLTSALEQRLITQQEYNALMEAAQSQHNEAMAGIDAYRYGDAALKAETFMGDMATAFAMGNEKMQKSARGFAAVEALINAWRAYNQTLADPSLPFLAKFAAGAKVLAAGMGAVNAIKGSGSGGGSGGAASGATATQTGASQGPLQVSLNTFGAGDFIRTADFGSMLDSLNKAAGDRGYTILVPA